MIQQGQQMLQKATKSSVQARKEKDKAIETIDKVKTKMVETVVKKAAKEIVSSGKSSTAVTSSLTTQLSEGEISIVAEKSPSAKSDVGHVSEKSRKKAAQKSEKVVSKKKKELIP